jgi:hypothetical protein
MARGGHRRGGAARSRGESSSEKRRLATARLQRLGGYFMGITPARKHQKALHTVRRANGGAGQLRRVIAQATEQ